MAGALTRTRFWHAHRRGCYIDAFDSFLPRVRLIYATMAAATATRLDIYGTHMMRADGGYLLFR